MNIKKIWLFMLLYNTTSVTSVPKMVMKAPQAIALSGPQALAKRLFKAQNLKDQSQFRSIMNQAIQQYRGNKAAFSDFLNTRDGYGCTSLLRSASIADIESIVFILKKIEEYYGTNEANVLDIFSFLNARCLQGHSAFYLLVQNGTKEKVELMLYHVIQLIGSQQELFFRFLTVSTFDYKWTALHWLAYQGSMETLKIVVIIAEKILGKDSVEFEQFINAEDENGETPLAKAYFNVRHKKFLLEHGATIIHKTPKEVEEARQLGLSLIEAIREDRFSSVQKIVSTAQERYKDQPRLFYEFFIVRTHGGWDPLMHAAALSYEYTAFLLHVAEKYFKNNEETFYCILRGVGQDGRGALYLTILRRNFEVSKLLIEKARRYSPNKFFLYRLMNVHTYSKGFTPLLAAVDFSSDRDEFFDIIETLIETIAQPFGKESRAVDLFVNTHDLDGFPPLAYATSPNISQILINYGARMDRSIF